MTGPTRHELWFRLIFSLFGLGLLGVAIWVRGIANAPALVEVIGVAGMFFAGSAIWTLRKLWQRRD